MIRLIQESEKEELISLLNGNKMVNYFMLLGFYGDSIPFSYVYGLYCGEELTGALAIRTSGNAQLYMTQYHSAKALMDVFKRHCVRSIITEKKSFQVVADTYGLKGIFQSTVMELHPAHFVPLKESILYPVKSCTPFDASRIKTLYTSCFQGSLSESGIRKNLVNHTGRGLLIEDEDKIISVAQTIFEDDGSAILFGVATDQAYRQRGYSKRILNALISELVKEKKQVYLMVENEIAQHIYTQLGFMATTTIEKYPIGEM